MIYETEPNGSFSTANLVPRGEQVSAQLSSRTDYDYFRFTVDTSGIITVTIVEPSTNRGSLPGYSYSIYDSNFILLGTGYGNGNQTYLPAKAIASSPGDYYVVVSYSYSAPVGIYQLNISTPQVIPPTPTYSLTKSATSVNEGAIATFTLATTNIAAGTSIPYTISGVNTNDLDSKLLTGNSTINAEGYALISIAITADQLTEGSEILTLTVNNQSSSIVINDTSTTQSNLNFTESNSLSLIVDKGILAPNAVLLKNLNEKIVLSNGAVLSHTIEYTGTIFDYNQIDSLIMTVTSDGDFTAEFRKEISDLLPAAANFSYQDTIKLVGTLNIDNVILYVAGADGNFVG